MKISTKEKRLILASFDKAAQEYAFRGTHSGSPRYDEVCEQYHDAKRDLEQLIGL